MKLFYTDIFGLPLPDGHPFPMAKYRLLRERLVAEGFEKDNQFCIPHAATDEELITAHDADYLKRMVAGDLSSQALRRLGLPWSSQLYRTLTAFDRRHDRCVPGSFNGWFECQPCRRNTSRI